MSKEQTPIEQIIELIMTDSTATLNAKALCDNVLKSYLVVEKEHIQAKVLEALEPQKELIEELLTIFDGNGVPNIKYVTRLIKEYYETAVKPKYEKERKQRSN